MALAAAEFSIVPEETIAIGHSGEFRRDLNYGTIRTNCLNIFLCAEVTRTFNSGLCAGHQDIRLAKPDHAEKALFQPQS
jgi:hypothetical protein